MNVRKFLPLAIICIPHPVSAGTAAFLPDGGRILRVDDGGVLLLETPGGAVPAERLKLPEGFAPEDASVAAAGDEVIVAGKAGAMAWRPGGPAERAWRLLWTPPEGQSVADVAADPKSGLIVLVTGAEDGESRWWAMPKGSGTAGKIYNRRAAGAAHPIFDAAGNLYFTRGGDVWKGSVEAGDHEEVPFVLEGARIWPLASLETGPGNSASTGAHAILPLRDYLLVELSRMGGSGWGNIVRIRNADAFEAGLPLKWDELETCDSGCDVALSADGRKAMIRIRSAGRWFKADPSKGDLEPVDSAPAEGGD